MKKHKRTRRTGILGLAMVLLLGGCLGKGGDGESQSKSESAVSEGTAAFQFLEETDLEWKDNTLDAYHAVLNLPVKQVRGETDVAGGVGGLMVCEAGAVRFKNHLTSYYKNDWSGVSGVTPEGEEFALRIETEPGLEGLQVDELGPMSGKRGYVACRDLYEGGKIIGKWFYELDENFGVVRSVQADLASYRSLFSLMGDEAGNYHLLYQEGHQEGGQKKYVILSPEGKSVFEAAGNFDMRFREWGGGRIAVCELETEAGILAGSSTILGRRFLEADLEEGKLSELAALKNETVWKETRENGVQYATLVDENTLVYSGTEGVYLCNARGEGTKAIYKWANHGIVKSNVQDVLAQEDGTIGLLYEDEEGYNYLLLTPTTEQREIKTITIAASSSNKAAFLSAAAYFNKKYPAYNVKVKDDYDETSLLTQLGAGEGPVLVDTMLTGFEELESLWQPLDGFLEATGLADDLIPQALGFGKIGNETYGVVTEFYIKTLVVADSGPTDWDYEGFLNYLESHKEAAFTYEQMNGPSDWRGFFFDALSNGLEDNYYLDAEGGTTIFGKREFDRVLKIAERAAKCPPAEDGKALREGEAVCEVVDLYSVWHLARLRARLEGNGRVLGYPTADGARTLLCAQSPIAMRSTATEEEKQMAYTFLKILLSRDSQVASIKGRSVSLFKVRKDVLEEQFREYAALAAQEKLMGYHDMPELDQEKDEKLLQELLSGAKVQKKFPAALERIFDEELEEYLSGRIDGKALSDHLANRVRLYLMEQK